MCHRTLFANHSDQSLTITLPERGFSTIITLALHLAKPYWTSITKHGQWTPYITSHKQYTTFIPYMHISNLLIIVRRTELCTCLLQNLNPKLAYLPVKQIAINKTSQCRYK